VKEMQRLEEAADRSQAKVLGYDTFRAFVPKKVK